MTTPFTSDQRTLRQALSGLAANGIIPAVALRLESTRDDISRALAAAVVQEIPAFTASGNPDVLPGLQQHVRDHVSEIARLFGGGEIGDFAFVREQAARRAAQRFPLEVMLHAYRCGHRVLSRWLRDTVQAQKLEQPDRAISQVADFAIEYTNAISTIAASEYVAHVRLLAATETDRRIELLNTLLAGYDESDARVAQLLKRAGYLEQRQSYCVVLVQSVNAAEMESPVRAQRIVESLADAMAGLSIRTLIGIRNNLVVAVLSDRRRQSGWTAPEASLAARVKPMLQLLGPAVVVGVSGDHPSTAYVPKALHEATAALDFASVGNRVVLFGDLPVRNLLVRHGAGMLRAAPPAWLQSLAEADAKADGALLATLRAIAEADLNVQRAARALARHPNTLYARIERINEICGLDGLRYRDLTELLLAADCWGL
jgi:DNA-binding PucR family transcriptional regulator